MALTKGFVKNAGMTALDTRKMLAGMVVTGADSLPRTGILATVYNDSRIADTTSSMAVIMRGATYVVSRSAGDGAVILTNDGSVTVPLDAAPAANSRIDVVYVKHNDNSDGNGDADSLPVFGVAKGDAAADPVRKSLPTGALGLFAVRIPAGVTATNASGVTVGNDAQFTAMEGGTIAYRTAAAMTADAANVRAPQLAELLTDNSVWQRAGSGWSRVHMPAPGLLRSQRSEYKADTVAAGTVMGSFTIAAQFVSQRVVVTVTGSVGFISSAGWGGCTLRASGSGVTVSSNGFAVGANADISAGPENSSAWAASTFAPLVRSFTVDIPANVASVVTVRTASSVACYYRATLDASTYISGEY